ncbi:MAG: MBL fold metallo-hydrolase [Clostridia bacterium]|nr:MBL fold metallo-hydrolase [Clostridia bacterium]
MAKKRKRQQNRFLPFFIILMLAAVVLLYKFDKLPLGLPNGDAETTADGSPNSPEASVGNGVTADTVSSSELSIHFLELGNKYTGDCTYIKAGDTDILIDAGSRVGSIGSITAYIDQYVTDGILEYVIVTHAHQDHYAGFATGESTDSIFDLYECKTIIDFALTNQKSDGAMYSNYIRERDAEIANGAVHYTAAECITENKSRFTLSDTVTLEILDSYYYYNESSDENNYSVCTLITEESADGDRNFLLTGDLEKEGESHLVDMNELPEVELFKAGHHGSPTSTTAKLLEVIKPKYVAVCCCCGSPEYTDNTANQFPSQDFIDRIASYTKNVYVTTLCVDYKNGEYTSMNGSIVFLVTDDVLSVSCSASTLPLYESEWFKATRSCPNAWKAAS